MKILIIDDEKEFAGTLCQRLQLRGYEVAEAYSGAEGIEELGRFLPQLVLLDLKMPDMSGLDLLKAIRDSWPAVRTVMLTGHGSGRAAEEALRLGAEKCLMKPVELAELLALIEENAEDGGE